MYLAVSYQKLVYYENIFDLLFSEDFVFRILLAYTQFIFRHSYDNSGAIFTPVDIGFWKYCFRVLKRVKVQEYYLYPMWKMENEMVEV